MTSGYGIVVFVGCDGEPVEPETLHVSYAVVLSAAVYVWGQWRPAKLDELVKTWPALSGSKLGREIWWQSTLEELRVAERRLPK